MPGAGGSAPTHLKGRCLPRPFPTSLRAEPACPPPCPGARRCLCLCPRRREGFQAHLMVPSTIPDLEHNCRHTPSPLTQGLTFASGSFSPGTGALVFRGSHLEKVVISLPLWAHPPSPWISTATRCARRVWTPQKPFPGCLASGREGRMQHWVHRSCPGQEPGLCPGSQP